MAFSIMTFSIMTFNIMTLGIMTFSITINKIIKCHIQHNAMQHNGTFVILTSFMLSVPNKPFMLSDTLLSANMLHVTILSVVAPYLLTMWACDDTERDLSGKKKSKGWKKWQKWVQHFWRHDSLPNGKKPNGKGFGVYKKRLVSRINPSLLLKINLQKAWTLQLNNINQIKNKWNYFQKIIKGPASLSVVRWYKCLHIALN